MFTAFLSCCEKVSFGYNGVMKKLKVASVVAVTVYSLSFPLANAQQVGSEPIYRFDPALSIESPRPASISADPNVVIEKRDDKTSLRLQTDGPISPYFDATQSPELSPEEVRLLQDKVELDPLGDYRLEAGIGVLVEDNASLNLGYRFHDPPSLLNEQRTDPLSLSGDLRISLDLKFPFD